MELKETYELKQNIQTLEKELKDLEDSSGITEMRNNLATLKKMLDDECRMHVSINNVVEGSLRIIDRGRTIRKINVERFRVIDRGAYECLTDSLTMPVGVVEKFFADYPNKAEIMDAICDTKRQEHYDIVDILEGD